MVRVRLILASLAVLGLSAEGSTQTVSAAPPRPQGVVSDASLVDSLVASVSAPVAVAALPDGRAVVLEKAGRARVIRNGVLLPTPALDLALSPCDTSERGLLGFAPDPLFAVNGLVYVYYTHPAPGAPAGCVNRVSRFRMSGDVIAPSSEVVLLDNIGSPRGNHNGGDVAVGNDGFLYVSVGDGGCSPRDPINAQVRCAGGNDAAQDLSLLNGKILRIDRTTGAPAPGNPFSGAGTAVCATRGNTPTTPTTTCREIFAYGLRNPWRFAFDPNTGATRFLINDVGQNTREEVDLGVLGANYGWPSREGVCAQAQNPPCDGAPAGLTQPITDYSHATTGSYITGGAFVPNGAWSKAFDGGYLFADGAPGGIFFRRASGQVDYARPLVTGVGGISDLDFVLDAAGWSLYYVNPSTSEVRKISPRYAPAPVVGGLAYVPATPTRVFDSARLGVNSGPLRGGSTRLVRVAGVQGAHRAAVLTITVVGPPNVTNVTAWYPRSIRPSVPTSVHDRGVTVANSAVVPIDADGSVLLHTTGTARVVVDVVGYFDLAPGGRATAGRFAPVPPTRAISTLSPPHPTTNRYTRTGTVSSSVVNVPMAGRYGVVPGVQTVALVVHALGSPTVAGGFVTAHAHGTAVPGTSNVNVNGPTDVRSNLVVVPVGADGSVDLELRNVSDVAVEVIGSFSGARAASSTRGTFVPGPARRVVDSRVALGLRRFTVPTSAGFNPPAVPDAVIGVVQNVWMVAPSGPGAMAAFSGIDRRVTGVNVAVTAAGQVRGTLAFTGMSGGAERIWAKVPTDVVVDVFGWFLT